MTFKLTAQQTAFIDGLLHTTDHIALMARAGCGKTSTILAAVDALRKHDPFAEIAVVAYNNAIADDVSQKLKKAGHTDWKYVQAQTLHSMGFGLLKYAFKPEIVGTKTRDIIAQVLKTLDLKQEMGQALTDAEQRQYATLTRFRTHVAQLVGYAKQAAVGFFPELPIEAPEVWHRLISHYGLEGLDNDIDAVDVVAQAQLVYRRGLEITDVIDFDDMILLPLIRRMRVRFGKDFIFLDEAQDLSPARQALARMFLKPRTGRMVMVGDDRQAIYGFSGADAEALPNMVAYFNATTYPLSVTWRCPKAVVAEAQRYVPDIEAAPSAPQGEVLALDKLPDDLKPGADAILCRNTAPLVTLAYALIRQGTPAKVEGRSIGDGLINLVQRWKVKTINALRARLQEYLQRETLKANAKGDPAKAEEVADRVYTLLEICAACNERNLHDVADVVSAINALFGDDVRGCVTLATYHRSKGREWPRVFLFEHAARCPSKAARQPWQRQQEDNLAYVAITRAQQTLAYIG